jgi:capsular exopolysaccharide synthesis family protein
MLNLPVRGATESGLAGAYKRDYISHAEISSFLRRYIRTILASVALVLSIAILYLIVTPPTYTARAQLLIDPKTAQPVRSSTDDSALLDGPQVESQIAILRSETIARGVVAALGLDHNPDFMGEEHGIRWQLHRFAHMIDGRTPPTPSPSDLQRAAIDKVIAGLDVGRIDISYAIGIAFSSKNPKLAAEIANATAKVYLRDLVETRAQAARIGSDWLEKRVAKLRKLMNAAARRAQEFKATQDYRIDRSGPPDDIDDGDAKKKPEEEPATLDELEATASTYRKIYENFYQAFTETVQRESYPVINARVISVAAVPTGKSYPKPAIILALGCFAGLLFGFAIALVRNAIDQPVRFSHQVRDELGLRSLGDIPKVLEPVAGSLRKRVLNILRRIGRRAANRRPPTVAINEVVTAPYSGFSEAIRRVKTTISVTQSGQPPKAVGIISALPHEGKSTVASNLAMAFAASGVRTLLVDADVRNRTLSNVLAPASTAGIANVTSDLSTLDAAIVSVSDGKLDFLPAGIVPETGSIAELSPHDDLRRLIETLSERYSVVIFDLPPSQSIAYAIPVASMLDGVVVIAESEATPMALLQELAINLRAVQTNVLGCAVTKSAGRHAMQKAQFAYSS